MKVPSLVRGWALLPQHNSPTVYSYGRLCMSSVTKLTGVSTWRPYLVEFRGSASSFRFAELNDAGMSTVGSAWSETDCIDPTSVVSDTQSTVPVCCYVKFPNDAAAQAVAKRCSLVRRILQVWGDGTTPHEALVDAEKHFEQRVDPVISAGTGKGTWRMQFERFGKEGRSGMTDEERRDLLTQLAPIGLKFRGRVDLKSPEHHLVYLEDWHTYHDELHALIAQIKTQRLRAVTAGLDSSHSVSVDSPDVAALKELEYKPLRCIIGRVVGEGPAVVTRFDLRYRPFIGTTSMNPLSAHLSANAARVTACQRVLDPFCGTGSLLVAAASLCADVVGSDIDGAGLLGSHVIPSTASSENTSVSVLPEVVLHSKNARFTRKGGQDQMGLCVMDNFAFYNLTERVVDMIGVGVDKWLLADDRSCDTVAFSSEWEKSEYVKIIKHGKFDAIVTDPPFGKRERAENDQATTSVATTAASAALPSLRTFECLGDPSAVLVTLFRVALQRVKRGGMLVFWLPTRAFTTAAEVHAYIGIIQQAAVAQQHGVDAGSSKDHAAKRREVFDKVGLQQSGGKETAGVHEASELRLLRVTAEELNDNLWRWLCVMQHS